MKTGWAMSHQQHQNQTTIHRRYRSICLLLDSLTTTGKIIGTVTTDNKGKYSMTWKPDISGDFQVFAFFEGTNGYWPSNAETTFNMAEPAATPTAAPTQISSAADMYFRSSSRRHHSPNHHRLCCTRTTGQLENDPKQKLPFFLFFFLYQKI